MYSIANPRVLVVPLLLALVLAACGGRSEPTPAPTPTPEPAVEAAPAAVGDVARGEQLFASSCVACHGPGGEGVPGLGKDMTHSEFMAGLSDAELVEFIKQGRAPDDPLNTTGVLMPPKGGNPAITDEQLFDIVAYLRTIHED
jgi:mono/diheme cytochrome c family protein